MRAALLALLLLAATAVLVPTSGADTPARARAQASVVTGGLGDFGTLTARGDDEQSDDDVAVQAEGVSVGKADLVARASRAGGATSSRAVALARRVDLFDGLVTASVARRTATAALAADRPRRPRRRASCSRAAASATSAATAPTCSPTAAASPSTAAPPRSSSPSARPAAATPRAPRSASRSPTPAPPTR